MIGISLAVGGSAFPGNGGMADNLGPKPPPPAFLRRTL